MADGALSRKDLRAPIRVRACQLVVTPDVMREIEKAQDEALREENIKKERMVGQQDKLEYNTLGVRTRFGRKPYGKIQPLDIPEWKWEHITMDFITKLPRIAKGHDTIWVIVDRLTKSAHFLPIRETFSSKSLAKVFINEVVACHGIPLTIVSNRDTRFTSRFWKIFHEVMGTRLNISTAYHPQTDGQSERTIQTLEDMLHACIIDFSDSWDSHLSLAEFSYNNNHHTMIGMPPYEMLYGRRCRTPVCWCEIGQKELGSLEVVRETSESNVESVALERNHTIQKERKAKCEREKVPKSLKIAPARVSSAREENIRIRSSIQVKDRNGRWTVMLGKREELPG
ncbi:hypothetical protein L1987_13367 [Smallanthus sonchifolius]|uniref:Uncharacterized protein n=1 Tax=Smallanthus sonchifolius TaxID=185202 RepID=A0ACB9JIK1_9ASTR|nr:hypothetical protein L1987_13367 [Smallanthus sonchifolius]